MVIKAAQDSRINRRALLGGATALAASVACPVFAQGDKPFTIVVPFPAGGRSTFIASQLGLGLNQVLGERIVVENRNGPVMREIAAFAQSEPDGRRLLLAGVRLPRRGVFESDEDNRLLDSLQPVTLVAREPMVLVMAEKRADELVFRDVADVLRFARAHPGRLTMASGMDGSTNDLAAELFKTLSRTYIPRLSTTGLSADTAAVLDGRIDLLFVTLHTAVGSIAQGQWRALAVTSGGRLPRPSLEGVTLPVMQSQPELAGYEVYDHVSVFAPPSASPAAADKAQLLCSQALAVPAVRQALLRGNAIPGGITRAEYRQLENDEESRWRIARARW